MLDTTKRTLATLTAATFLGAGGWAIAGNANSSATTGQAAQQQADPDRDHGPGHRGMPGASVSAADLASITAAVVAKFPGATVERAMKAPDGTYHAHVVKSDGTEVHAALSADFAVTGVDTGRFGRHGDRPGPGPMMGASLDADALAKVTAAVAAKLPGATVDFAMKAPNGTYHAAVTKTDGTHVHVALNSSFAVTAVTNRPRGMRGGPGRPGEAITGTALAKVTAAVTARLPGATVERAMKAPDGTYHAHVVTKAGKHVHVALSAAFAVTSVDQARRGPHGERGPGGSRHEAALTGDTAAKVTAAALAAVPGATVNRVERDADGATYEAHITKADGTRATVKLDGSFAVTGIETP